MQTYRPGACYNKDRDLYNYLTIYFQLLKRSLYANKNQLEITPLDF